MRTRFADPLIPVELSKNNFDLIRFFLATAVIYSHCFGIYFGYSKIAQTEPGSLLTRNQAELGGVAVSFFFIISGFLIAKSFENSKTLTEYLIKRILRICPGFYVAFLVSLLALGAAGTLFPPYELQQLRSYFQGFPVKKLTFEFFTLQTPGGPKTFASNPIPNKINEALWTIQYEFFCYLLIPVLGIVSSIKRRWFSLVLFSIAYLLLIFQTTHLVPYNFNYPGTSTFLYPSEMPRLFSFFFAGSCIYYFRDRIKSSTFLLLASITMVLFGAWWVHGFDIVMPIAGSYLVFCFAYHPRVQFHDFAKRGDLSYGLYLYGWPIQQLVMYFFYKHLDPNRLFFISFPIVYLAAYLSWHLIENPFLKMKAWLKKSVQNEPIIIKS